MPGIIAKEFSELSLDELYSLIQCRQEVFVTEQHCFYQDLDGLDRHSIHLIVADGNEVVGYLRVIRPGFHGENAVIGRVAVRKDSRGNGIGRMMMKRGIEIARTLSQAIDIEAQAYLKTFYESLGFKALSEPYIHADTPHIHMRLTF